MKLIKFKKVNHISKKQLKYIHRFTKLKLSIFVLLISSLLTMLNELIL